MGGELTGRHTVWKEGEEVGEKESGGETLYNHFFREKRKGHVLFLCSKSKCWEKNGAKGGV